MFTALPHGVSYIEGSDLNQSSVFKKISFKASYRKALLPVRKVY